MYCRNCGNQITELDSFCPKCGTRAVKIITFSPLVRNAGVSAVLSTIIPGLGQIYNGQIKKGVPIIIASIVLLILAIAMRMPERIGVYVAYILLWMLSIFDAYRSAEKINSKIE